MKILHIRFHYGGGVYTVLKAWTEKGKINENILTCFSHLY